MDEWGLPCLGLRESHEAEPLGAACIAVVRDLQRVGGVGVGRKRGGGEEERGEV